MKRNPLWLAVHWALGYQRAGYVMHGINAYGFDVLHPYYVVGIR